MLESPATCAALDTIGLLLIGLDRSAQRHIAIDRDDLDVLGLGGKLSAATLSEAACAKARLDPSGTINALASKDAEKSNVCFFMFDDLLS
jgi:hypothetical protein